MTTTTTPEPEFRSFKTVDYEEVAASEMVYRIPRKRTQTDDLAALALEVIAMQKSLDFAMFQLPGLEAQLVGMMKDRGVNFLVGVKAGYSFGRLDTVQYEWAKDAKLPANLPSGIPSKVATKLIGTPGKGRPNMDEVRDWVRKFAEDKDTLMSAISESESDAAYGYYKLPGRDIEVPILTED